MHHHRAVELRAEPGLVGRAEVVAVFEWRFQMAVLVGLVEHRRRPRRSAGAERAARCLASLAGSRPITVSSGARFFRTLCTMCERKFSASSSRPSRSQIGHLRLDHPELGQVAAGLRLFRAEGRAEAVDLAQRQSRGLDIKLAGLRQDRPDRRSNPPGKSVEVPSQAAGVRMGGSVRMKPLVSKYSAAARMISARMRRMADWRGERTHRWRCSIRKSTPCSLSVMG